MADGDYLTQAQLKARFGNERELAYLTDDQDTGIVQEGDLDDAIEWAEGMMNVHLAVRYAAPVSSTETSVIEFLRRLAGDLAEYHMRGRKPPVDETTQAKYDQALETLTKLSDGSLVLPGATTATSTTSREPRLDWSASNRTASSNSARSFSRTTSARL